ncbi:integrin alpha-PS3-like [Spodoptera litura]|uniref:Integrin alpha-PS3-like n=1 Tax=Spodoptera litura TaxID=69820 RepID=A0A9J7IKW8_SPOLT|nr:integrin alpha-PS3-like [Spodoptera litura]
MAKESVLSVVLVLFIHLSTSSHVFHEKTSITFRPEYDAEYFGYSIILSPDGLLVGAPKAKELKESSTGIKTGMVFNCSLVNLDVKLGSCTAVKRSGRSGNDNMLNRLLPGFLRDDMWYGASMVLLPGGRLLVNAPRWTSPYGTKHLLMNGVSLLQTRRGNRPLHCLKDYNHQAYVTHGSRREYGAYGTHLNFYAYGQAGISAAISKMNTVILGAPGLLQWTGGVISLSFFPNDTGTYTNKLPTMNPYFTMDLGPDEYFGYSVDSGIFDGRGEVMYVAGAPRYNIASGQVIIFVPPTEELVSLTIKAKIRGPQTGSYFGASVCCTDLNGDGFDDLLVGAPTYVKDDGGLPYDQGAVFVYLSKEKDFSFILVESGIVTGSGTNGAWFGLTIADLGDIDGNGFKDVAIGAPWEDDGIGAVYIYRGCSKGLSTDNVQRIQTKTARGFGWSIAKGVDIDQNNCSDLAIGAHNSQTAYVYRGIPTIKVHASIKVPNAINLPYNTTSFQAEFCVSSPPMELWPHVELNIIANIEADPESNRAMISGDSKYNVRVTPGIETCDVQEIEVNPTADLSKPIKLVFQLEPDELMKDNSSTFLMNAARLSEESTLKTSFLIQLMRDCGEDLICTPWLDLTLEPLNNPYVPGSNGTLGARITIVNEEEPAYAAKVNISLPISPKRIPSECSLEFPRMTCDVPSPLLRGEKIVWDIELDYEMNHDANDTRDTLFGIRVELTDPLYRHVTDDNVTDLFISVAHEAKFSVSGKPMPNATLSIPRDSLAAGTNYTFKHYFEITNLGPSDTSALEVYITIPDKTTFSTNISGCVPTETPNQWMCFWSVPAKVTQPVYVPLQMDLSKEGNYLLENTTYNATTKVTVLFKKKATNYEVTTRLILEPESITWKLILICVLLGLLVLAVIVTILYKRGFFQRTTRRMLQEQKNNQRLLQESDSSSGQMEEHDVPLDDSDEEL